MCQGGFASCVKVLIEECHADPNCKAEVLLVYWNCLQNINIYMGVVHMHHKATVLYHVLVY